MKKYLPYLLIAGLCVALFFSMKGCVKKEVRERLIIQAAEQMPDSGRLWRDRYEREHRTAMALSGDYKFTLATNGRLLDSISRMLNVRKKRIQTIVQLTTQLEGQAKIAVQNQRSQGLNHIAFDFADNWMQLHGEGDIEIDSMRELTLDYFLRDSLLFTTMRKRVGLFGKMSTYVDVMSSNPKMHIGGISTIEIRDRPKRFGIGLQIGSTYNGTSWYPYAGLGISYNLIRF